VFGAAFMRPAEPVMVLGEIIVMTGVKAERGDRNPSRPSRISTRRRRDPPCRERPMDL